MASCDQKKDCMLRFTKGEPAFLKKSLGKQKNSACGDPENTKVFVQIPCVINSDRVVNNRQVEGLFIGCMGVFIALFNMIFIDYLRNVFKNQFIEWDVKTITAGDYSVELDIP